MSLTNEKEKITARNLVLARNKRDSIFASLGQS